MNQITPWFPSPPGCAPCFDPSQLLQCWCDIQATTALIAKVVTDLAANDPAFQQALAQAIVASGSNIPLIGVTNGADAQPGQVGQWVQFVQQVAIPNANANSQSVTFGVLPPGDWDVWISAGANADFTSIDMYLNPTPPGFNGNVGAGTFVGGNAISAVIVGAVGRALTTVPTLIVYTIVTNASNTATLQAVFNARRMR